MEITTEIFTILLLLCLNGIFSMAEMAVVSSRRARLLEKAEQGNKGARAALDLANNPGSFLSTVQIGITLVGILAGAFGGATIAEKFTPIVAKVSWFSSQAETISFGIVVFLITYLSLVIGELIPKRIALHSPEKVSTILARPMRAIARIVSPVVHILEASTNIPLRLFGLRDSVQSPVTEEEVKILIRQGLSAGVFEKSETEIMERALHLTDRRVRELMIPRTDMVWLNIEDSPGKIMATIQSTKHSRFPVGQGSPDHLIGIVRSKDILSRLLNGKEMDIKADLLTPIYLPESVRAFKALEIMRDAKRHLALVADEYGGVEGIITISDIIESLVGNLPSGDRADEQMIVTRPDGSWLIDGMTGVQDLKRILSVSDLPEEESGFETMAGLVMAKMGRIPGVADSFEWGGYRFEVIDMDRHRIDRVLVSRIADNGLPGTPDSKP
ncbi:MAG: HlyC/CorC family transporter [Leptospirales bacterium]|nr:HlyC/CorC family transporter [Leptospirales bacterium]